MSLCLTRKMHSNIILFLLLPQLYPILTVNIVEEITELKIKAGILLKMANDKKTIFASDCDKIYEILENIQKEYEIHENAVPFREWWFKHRESVAASRKGGAQILMPNHVQYFSEMSEHLDSTPSYSRGEIRQWLHDYLAVGSGSPSGSGIGRDESSSCGNDSGVQLIYHEVFEENNNKLFHPAILVYNTVIHFYDQKGLFIETKNSYICKIRGKPPIVRPLNFNAPELKRVQQILDKLAYGQFAAGSFDLMTNNCFKFAWAFLKQIDASAEALAILESIRPTEEILQSRKQQMSSRKRHRGQ